MNASSHRVGNLTVNRLFELDLDGFEATRLLPGLDLAALARHPAGLDPRVYDAATGKVRMSVHTWVVRGEGRTVLIDTGAGNGKARPTMGVLDNLHGPYLARLAELGVRPEEVDAVLLTHVHADHVGWNTQRRDGRWVPTFPNATVVVSDL